MANRPSVYPEWATSLLNDGPLGGDDAADGGSHAQVDIGHGRHMVVNKRKLDNVAQLLPGLLIHLVGPNLYWTPFVGKNLFDRHFPCLRSPKVQR